jgi:hypothetical protein
MTSRPASWNGTDASLGRADQLAALRQGPPIFLSVRPGDRKADVGYGKGRIR